MKTFIASCLFLLSFTIVSQAQTFSGLDTSPMDMAYFPDNFAHDRKPGDKAIIRVTYSRPAKKDRAVFGQLVPYGKVWRMGANEAAEIKFYQDVEWNGKKVKAGTYSLFSIPQENEWIVILNSDLDYWGAYSYQAKNDVLRVAAKKATLENPVEHFTIQFVEKGSKQGAMRLAWDQTVAEVPFRW